MVGIEFCTIMKRIAATSTRMLDAAINRTVRNTLSPNVPVLATNPQLSIKIAGAICPSSKAN